MSKFEDFPARRIRSVTVGVRGKKSRVIVFELETSEILVVAKKAVSKVASALGLRKSEFVKLAEKEPARLLRIMKNSNVVLMTFRVIEEDQAVYYVYNAATEKFTPVRHRDVRAAAEAALNEIGIRPLAVFTKKFRRRLVYYFVLDQVERGGASISLELAVSNANTARDAIHIYPHATIKTVSGLVRLEMSAVSASKVVVHVGEVHEILSKVKSAVKEVAAELLKDRAEFYCLLGRLMTMKYGTVYELTQIVGTLPRKYIPVMREAEERYLRKDTITVIDVIAALQKVKEAVQDSNETLAKKLESVIRKLISNAKQTPTYQGTALPA